MGIVYETRKKTSKHQSSLRCQFKPTLTQRFHLLFVSGCAGFSELAADSSVFLPGEAQRKTHLILYLLPIWVALSHQREVGEGGGNADVFPTGRFKALATWNTTAAVVLGATIVHFPESDQI